MGFKTFLVTASHKLQFSQLVFDWHMTFSIPESKTSASHLQA